MAEQSTLRRMRAHLAQPATLAVLAGIAGIVTLVGPFGTDELLRPFPRLAYWTVLAISTYGVGFLAGEVVGPRLRETSRPAQVLAVGCATGMGVVVVVLAVNFATFGYLPPPSEVPGFLVTLFGIALLITMILQVVDRPPGAAQDSAPPPILDRVPLHRRGELVALSVEDHYVRIRTDRGEELVLMRLGDAIREAAGVPGLQVHRSHWVALGQVAEARREGDRAMLTMRHGGDIPVSRANVPAIREAGLLPR